MTLARGMEVTVGIVLMSFLAAGIGWPATPPGDNEVVAKVNGIAITKDQVRQRVDIYERAHPGLAPGESRIRRAGIAAQVLIYAILTEQLYSLICTLPLDRLWKPYPVEEIAQVYASFG